MVIPETYFSDIIAKIVLPLLKKIVDTNDINYIIFTIFQSSKVKYKWQ